MFLINNKLCFFADVYFVLNEKLETHAVDCGQINELCYQITERKRQVAEF